MSELIQSDIQIWKSCSTAAVLLQERRRRTGSNTYHHKLETAGLGHQDCEKL
jgi:hypothetical protein